MTFFFDENLGKQLSDGLQAFGEDACHHQDCFDAGTPDVIWLKVIGKRGWFLITQDRSIRKNRLELETLKQYKVGAFFLLGKSMSRWDYIKQIVRSWDQIKEKTISKRPPFIFQVNRHGTKLQEIHID